MNKHKRELEKDIFNLFNENTTVSTDAIEEISYLIVESDDVRNRLSEILIKIYETEVKAKRGKGKENGLTHVELIDPINKPQISVLNKAVETKVKEVRK